MDSKNLKIVSYNIHKGFSLFGRTYTLGSIKSQLKEWSADFVFLQEVRGLCPKGDYSDQLEHLADSLWPHTSYGKNAVYSKAHHGNAIMSRYPIVEMENRNVSRNRFERRGILYSKIQVEGSQRPLHLFCLHLNLLERDRFHQAEELLRFVDVRVQAHEPVIVAGDFNDWTGKITKYLSQHLPDWNILVPPIGTFPSFYPLLKLDVMLSKNLEFQNIEVLKPKGFDHPSDHLPLLAELTLRL